jgi:hypothetical protein
MLRGLDMKLAPIVLSIGGLAVVGTILAAALPARPGVPTAEAPVLPAKPLQTAANAVSPVPTKPAPAPVTKPATQSAAAQVPATPPAAATPSTSAPAAQVPTGLSKAELDQLVAPIALYPDQLLGQVLMASTYSADVVEASRWVSAPEHRALKGAALETALRDRRWDPSVMALVPFPSVLEALSARLEWTRHLGGAFVAQRTDVMDAVQRLRQAAMTAGTLKSGTQCQCEVQANAGIVTITPAKHSVVHVPVYNPVVAFGTWPSPANPPVVLPVPAGYAFIGGIPMGYGVGVEVDAYGPLWGWGRVDWAGHAIIVDLSRYNLIPGAHATFAGGIWVHEPSHRTHVAEARIELPHHVAIVHHAARHPVVVVHHRAPPPWETAQRFAPAYPGYSPGPYSPWPPHVAMGGPFGYYGPR